MRKSVLALALTCLVTAPAQASTVAMNLGSVLGSEVACGLKFDQAAIARFIESRVKPSDMGFAGMLNLMTIGARAEIDDMTASQKTAHCTQIRRVARSYKLIE
ncbi:MAG: signal recognition particle [Beijerinckiaceae bacterium]|nr:signal recognition particle [Beijerinckiaceae bacterium]